MRVRKYGQRERYEKMIEMYKQGYPVDEICEELEYKEQRHVVRTLRMLGLYQEETSDLDVPKILALRKAGWHMDKILDEFGHRYTAAEIIAAVEKYDRTKKSQKGKEFKNE